MSHCFIHIGAPKTGSTFLQRLLFDNRDASAADVLYPDVSLRGYGHHDLAFLLAGGYPDWATPQPIPLPDLVQQLASAVRTHQGSIVLSSENFFLFPMPAELRQILLDSGALTGRRPTIVVYVRAQDDAHESWYNQVVKAQGATQGIEECIDRWIDLWDYRQQLERWAAVFGDENIAVRPYEERQFANGSLADDFLSIIGVSRTNVVVPHDRVNTGLNRDVLEFQRLMNHLPLSIQEKRGFHHQLIELCARATGAGLFDEGSVLSGAQRTAIRKRYEDGNTEVAQRYLGSSRLFLENDVPTTGGSAEHLTVDKLTYIVGWLLARSR
jgi:hypothetical protein